MSLTDKEKEIALECAKQADMCTEERSLVVSRRDVLVFTTPPAAPLPEGCGWAVIKGGRSICQPPKRMLSAPCNCKELVEALQEAQKLLRRHKEAIRKDMDEQEMEKGTEVMSVIREALANNAKRMKGEK